MKLGILGLLLAWGCARPVPVVTPVTAAELVATIRTGGAAVTVVNMWATWCGPCREEFPDLLKVQRAYAGRGVKVVLVAWDTDVTVAQKFLASQGVDFASFIKADVESDPRFIDGVEPKWSGAFPATMIYDGTGGLRALHEGQMTYAELAAAVERILQPITTGGT